MAKTSTTKRAASASSAPSKKTQSKAKPKGNGSAVGDAKLVTSVRKAVSKIPLFKNMEIRINAEDGVVTLTGTSSAQFKKTAGSTARSVQSVKRVVNNLKVPPQSAGCFLGLTECYCNGQMTCVEGSCPKCGGL